MCGVLVDLVHPLCSKKFLQNCLVSLFWCWSLLWNF